MNIFHSNIKDRWGDLSIFEQMANIGAEVGRTINWRNKGNAEMSRNAFFRALELIDFTMEVRANEPAVKEVSKVREVLADYFMGDNIYKSTDEQWNKYFHFFNLVARKDR